MVAVKANHSCVFLMFKLPFTKHEIQLQTQHSCLESFVENEAVINIIVMILS